MVVLDAPGLEGEDDGHEHEGPNDVLQQLVLAESTVTAVMANDKPLQIKRLTG